MDTGKNHEVCRHGPRCEHLKALSEAAGSYSGDIDPQDEVVSVTDLDAVCNECGDFEPKE
ncbi:MAG TPA: hypothetical protein VEI04_07020 [Syntrophobacteria bacterium]|nr:hypothetical protein [Syntrophobacteria bacterium]